MPRVAHTLPAKCAAEDCPSLLAVGLLLCPSCWRFVSVAARDRVHETLHAWQQGGPVADLLSACEQAKRQASGRIARAA